MSLHFCNLHSIHVPTVSFCSKTFQFFCRVFLLIHINIVCYLSDFVFPCFIFHVKYAWLRVAIFPLVRIHMLSLCCRSATAFLVVYIFHKFTVRDDVAFLPFVFRHSFRDLAIHHCPRKSCKPIALLLLSRLMNFLLERGVREIIVGYLDITTAGFLNTAEILVYTMVTIKSLIFRITAC